MISFFSKKRSPLGMVCYDGLIWHARVFRFSDDTWTSDESAQEVSRNNRQIPHALLSFLTEQGAARVRILLPGEVRALRIALSGDLSDEEIHSVVRHSLFEELDSSVLQSRFATARASLFGMSDHEDQLLVSLYELRHINRFIKDLDEAGLQLEAVGSLELAVLDWHARNHSAAVLLFIGRQTAFHVVPEHGEASFMTAALPLGIDAPLPAARERTERAVRRIAALRELPLQAVVLDGMTKEHLDWIQEELPECAGDAWTCFSEVRDAVLACAAESAVGGTESAAALIGPPPAPRDPHRSGTVIMACTLILSLLFLQQQWSSLRSEQKELEKRSEAWETLKAARSSAAAEYKTVCNRRSALDQKMRWLCGTWDRLPDGLLPVLDALGAEPTPYTRIVFIEELNGHEIRIDGITLWQKEVTRLNKALRETAEREGLQHEIEEVSAPEGQRVQNFRFIIKSGGGAS